MRISVEDGIIVCSLEEEEGQCKSSFLRETYGIFNGYYKDKLRLFKSFGKDYGPIPDKQRFSYTYAIDHERFKIGNLIRIAKFERVDIDEEAFALLTERLEALQNLAADYMAVIEREREEESRQKQWQRKCERGCGECKYLTLDGDDHVCAYSGDLLNQENVPQYVRGVYYLFYLVPFPSEGCIYKYEKKENKYEHF